MQFTSQGDTPCRVGVNQVEDTLRVFDDEGIHDLQTIALVKVEAAGVVAVGELGRLKHVRPLGDDGVLGAELRVVVRVNGRRRFGGDRRGSATPPYSRTRVRLRRRLGLLGRHAWIGSIRRQD